MIQFIESTKSEVPKMKIVNTSNQPGKFGFLLSPRH